MGVRNPFTAKLLSFVANSLLFLRLDQFLLLSTEYVLKLKNETRLQKFIPSGPNFRVQSDSLLQKYNMRVRG